MVPCGSLRRKAPSIAVRGKALQPHLTRHRLPVRQRSSAAVAVAAKTSPSPCAAVATRAAAAPGNNCARARTHHATSDDDSRFVWEIDSRNTHGQSMGMCGGARGALGQPRVAGYLSQAQSSRCVDAQDPLSTRQQQQQHAIRDCIHRCTCRRECIATAAATVNNPEHPPQGHCTSRNATRCAQAVRLAG
jgi:hypothetical protein